MTNAAHPQWTPRFQHLLTFLSNGSAMRLSLICALALVSACGSHPGPQFSGVDPTRVTIGPATYDIRVQRNTAQAVRINTLYAPRSGPLAGFAALAMEQVSGCSVSRIKGDAAVMIGSLSCHGKAAPSPERIRGTLDCVTVDSYVSAATDQLVEMQECDWIAD